VIWVILAPEYIRTPLSTQQK
jgi:Transposase, Mutator family